MGSAGAGGAQPAAASRRRRPSFARVLAEMFSDDPRAAAIALPTRPLHLMYAEPAREYIESHGGEVRTGADRDRSSMSATARVAGVRAGDETVARRAVSLSAVPWFALADLFDAAPPALERRPRSRAPHGLVADRDGESLVRPPRPRRAVCRPARPGDAMGVRQAPGAWATTRRTCRWCRAAPRRFWRADEHRADHARRTRSC